MPEGADVCPTQKELWRARMPPQTGSKKAGTCPAFVSRPVLSPTKLYVGSEVAAAQSRYGPPGVAVGERRRRQRDRLEEGGRQRL